MATWTVMFVMLGVIMANTENIIQIDMAPNSVDDMYHSCKDKMEKKVQEEFLLREKRDEKFSLAWSEAEKYYKEKWSPENRTIRSSPLTRDQIIAIHTYTLKEPNVFSEFNAAVREGKNNYTTTFKYHTLHFFLTEAVQALNSQRSESQRCVTTYRGVNRTMTINQGTFRFGSFTSSSVNSSIPLNFGNKTCFKIYTCFGADITQYSRFEEESEVLIPPYEVFEVIKSDKTSEKNHLPCEIVYNVESTKKPQSILNCYLV